MLANLPSLPRHLLEHGEHARRAVPPDGLLVEHDPLVVLRPAVQALEGTELDGRDLRVRAYFSN